jgi:hypothetical protein
VRVWGESMVRQEVVVGEQYGKGGESVGRAGARGTMGRRPSGRVVDVQNSMERILTEGASGCILLELQVC